VFRRSVSSPVCASRIRTVCSVEPLAKRLPSGLKPTLPTTAGHCFFSRQGLRHCLY
jgi:hypothetical protein